MSTNGSTVKVDQPPTLGIGRLVEAGHFYGDYHAKLPVGLTIKDALRPEFWVSYVHMFQPNPVTGSGDGTGSIIVLRTEDHAFIASLYVRAVQKRGLVVEVMIPDETGVCYFGQKVVANAKDFETRWNVGKKGFDVIRKSDREIVGDGAQFPIKELAYNWIEKMTRV